MCVICGPFEQGLQRTTGIPNGALVPGIAPATEPHSTGLHLLNRHRYVSDAAQISDNNGVCRMSKRELQPRLSFIFNS